MGETNGCACLTDGAAMCWGYDGGGELGNGPAWTSTDAKYNPPVQVLTITTAKSIALGTSHTIAMLTDGQVMSLGNNEKEQLGNGNNAASYEPVFVSGLPISAPPPPPYINPPPSPSPPPPPPMSLEELVAAAEEKTEQAEVSRDALLAAISDEETKAKAKLLADAVITGVKVQKLVMALTAESDDAACTQAFSKMKLDASFGACDVVVSASRRRRLVADTAYDVTVLMDPATVTETTLAAALRNLAAGGVTATSTETDPTEELRLIPGIDASSLESFVTDAAIVADATSVATEAATQPPSPPPLLPPPALESPPSSPPPSPPLPPPRLVVNDYDSSPASGVFGVRKTRAIILCAAIAALTA